MKKQPDFAALFLRHFGDVPTRVTYQVRQDSNRFHDLVFLISLIHDARFKREDVSLRGKRLSIPIERDCWELGTVQRPNGAELHLAQAWMTISPVLEIEWRFEHAAQFAPDTELWIQEIWLDRRATRADDTMPVIIKGFTWECVLTVHEPDLKIRLQDLETPHLYSAPKKDRAGMSAAPRKARGRASRAQRPAPLCGQDNDREDREG